MATLAEIIAQGIGIIDDVLDDGEVLEPVTLERWTGQDLDGDPTYAAAITPKAIIEIKQRLRKDANGQEVMSKTKLTFTAPIADEGTAGRREPIDPNDKITLPDGTTGPIIDVDGLVSGNTAKPYMLEVWMG